MSVVLAVHVDRRTGAKPVRDTAVRVVAALALDDRAGSRIRTSVSDAASRLLAACQSVVVVFSTEPDDVPRRLRVLLRATSRQARRALRRVGRGAARRGAVPDGRDADGCIELAWDLGAATRRTQPPDAAADPARSLLDPDEAAATGRVATASTRRSSDRHL